MLVQAGQTWERLGTRERFLVTRLYRELFSEVAMLRNNKTGELIRVKVEREQDCTTIPGFEPKGVDFLGRRDSISSHSSTN